MCGVITPKEFVDPIIDVFLSAFESSMVRISTLLFCCIVILLILAMEVTSQCTVFPTRLVLCTYALIENQTS